MSRQVSQGVIGSHGTAMSCNALCWWPSRLLLGMKLFPSFKSKSKLLPPAWPSQKAAQLIGLISEWHMVLKEQVLICRPIGVPSTKVPVVCAGIGVLALNGWDWGLLSTLSQTEGQHKVAFMICSCTAFTLNLCVCGGGD